MEPVIERNDETQLGLAVFRQLDKMRVRWHEAQSDAEKKYLVGEMVTILTVLLGE